MSTILTGTAVGIVLFVAGWLLFGRTDEADVPPVEITVTSTNSTNPISSDESPIIQDGTAAAAETRPTQRSVEAAAESDNNQPDFSAAVSPVAAVSAPAVSAPSESLSPTGDGVDSMGVLPGQPDLQRPPQLTASLAQHLQTDVAAYDQSVKPFFTRHCVSCHGTEKQEGGLRLDNMDTDFGKSVVANRWTEIMDRINAGEMPPEDRPRPDVSAMSEVTGWITTELRRRESALKSTGGRVVLRRLNRTEYNNTMRDLFGVDISPAQDFPADTPSHGFDNIGAALLMSPLQIEKYMAAARRVLDEVIPNTPRPPQPVKWQVRIADVYDFGTLGGGQYQVGNTQRPGWDGRQMQVHVAHNMDGRKLPFPKLQNGMVTLVPRAFGDGSALVRGMRIPGGHYIVRVRAASVIPSRQEVIQAGLKGAEDHAVGNQWVQQNRLPLLRKHFRENLDYEYGPPRMAIYEYTTKRTLALFDVDAPIDRPQVYEFRVHLQENADGFSIVNRYHVPYTFAVRVSAKPDFPRPILLVDYLEFEGPVVDQWPPKSQTALLSSLRGNDEEKARQLLTDFMPRAWRRPVSDEEVNSMIELFNQFRRGRPDFAQAIKTPLVAVLSSPHFLYLTEESPNRVPSRPRSQTGQPPLDPLGTRLSEHQLASRLSYFIWSTMPDEELSRLAEQGRLMEHATLTAQLDRMLADDRSDQFVENFAGQWLGLREVGANPPAKNLFRRYDPHLAESSVRETLGFFAEILRNDIDVRSFIKSDFVTINARLARHYNIPNVRGDEIRRVPAPRDSHRGGLLTQASIHTITSNGTRTSPVLRGKWILDNLLDDPPPPPPPNAGEIPQPVPGEGQVTVRRRLEIHRQLPACAACHNKIDPLGFALENFRADSTWAEQEAHGYEGWITKNDPTIDVSARMPDGRQLNGVAELQNILLAEEDKFLNCLARKVATYALGRGLEFSDREWIASLVTEMKQNGRTLRGLMKQIVTSEQFRSQ